MVQEAFLCPLYRIYLTHLNPNLMKILIITVNAKNQIPPGKSTAKKISFEW